MVTTTDTFKIYLYDSNNNVLSQLTTGMTYTTTAGLIKKSASSPFARTNTVVYSNNTVKLFFLISTALTTNAKVKVIIPLTQLIQEPINADKVPTCSDGTNAIACTLDTTTDPTSLIFEMDKWCTSCVANTQLNLEISNVRNTNWTTAPASVTIQTLNN